MSFGPGGSRAPALPYWRLSAWYFSYFAFIGAFSPYFGLYLLSLGHSAWHISVLLSLMQMMRLVAPNLWSYLSERIGSKTPVIRVAALLSLLGFASFFFTSSFVGLFFGMTLLAFFWSASLPLVEALTLGHLQHQAERYGSIRLWGSVGFIIAVLGVGALLDVQALANLLWVSLLLLGAIFACALALPEAPTVKLAETLAPLRVTLRRRQVQALLAASFLMSAAHGPLYVFYSIHLVEHGYGKTLVGGLWALGVVAEILVFLYMPRALQRHSLRAILLVSFACAVLRFLVIGWGADSLALLLLAQLLHGVTFGAYHAAAVAALHHWFPGSQQARAQALYGSVSFGAGGMLGGLLSGRTWEILGPGWTYSLGALFALIGLILVWRGLNQQESDDGSEIGRT